MAETNIKHVPNLRQLSQPNSCGNTKVEKIDFAYEWTIDNLEDILERKYEVPSPVFSCDESGRIKWKLVLFKAHKYPEGPHMAASLIKASNNAIPYNVLYSLSVVDEFGKSYPLLTREKVFSKYLDFDEELLLSHAELIKSGYLFNKSFKMRCNMNILIMAADEDIEHIFETSNGDLDGADYNLTELSAKGKEIKGKSLSLKDTASNSNSFNIVVEDVKVENTVPSFSKSLNHLSENLRALYLSKSYADIAIVCEGQEIRAHKAIISARSDYFKNACAETVNHRIMLDVKKPVMDLVLFYLYTGKIQNVSMDLTLDLLSAAKKLRIFHLQESVIDVLKSNLTVDNVTDVLQKSEDLKLKELKNACLLFANANHSEVVLTEKWKKMIKNNPHIAGEVLLTIASFQKRNVL